MTNFRRDENGQDMVEYGLVVALIALIVMAALATFGTDLKAGFISVDAKVVTNVK